MRIVICTSLSCSQQSSVLFHSSISHCSFGGKSVSEKARERARWPRNVNFCYYVNFFAVQFPLFSRNLLRVERKLNLYIGFSSLWCSLISMMAFFSRRRPDTTQKLGQHANETSTWWGVDWLYFFSAQAF